VSADGSMVITGAPSDNSSTGAVFVYAKNSSGYFVQQGPKLVGTNSTASEQGITIALSADGTTLAVGGIYDSSFVGATWVYAKNASGYFVQQGPKIVGSGYIGAPRQGYSLALSSDGSILAVGGYYDNTGPGATWVFARNASGYYIQQGSKLVGTGATGTNIYQGYSIGLSSNGSVLAVGGYGDNTNIGAVWIFTRNSSGLYTQQGSKLVGTDHTGTSYMGRVLTMTPDASTIAFSGYADNTNMGAVWIAGLNSSGLYTIQGSKLVGTGNTGTTIYQGYSIGLSSDGSRLVFGGYGDNTNIGATWVFAKNTSGYFVQQGSKLVGTGNTGASNQGYSIALSSDGSTLAVGGYEDNTNIGATWVFAQNTSGYFVQQHTKIVGQQYVGTAHQGYRVALNSNGVTLGVGGYTDNSSVGAVWAFQLVGAPTLSPTTVAPTRAPTTIAPTPLPTASPTAMSISLLGSALVGTGYNLGLGGSVNQGNAVALSADSDTLVVGGYMDDDADFNDDESNGPVGAAWVFTRPSSSPSTTTFTQFGSKINAGIGDTNFGSSVASSSNGSVIAIGAINDDGVYMFHKGASSYSALGSKLQGTGESSTGSSQQGASVAMSNDAGVVATGGVYDNTGRGAVWVFTFSSSGAYNQYGTKLVGTGYTGVAYQGTSVALSSNGSILASGGYYDNTGVGATWVFIRNSTGAYNQYGTKLVGTGNSGASNQGISVALSADGSILIVGGKADNSNIGAIWVFMYSPAGSYTQLGPKLVGTSYSGSPLQGTSVSISADASIVVVGGPGDASNLGAFWVFRPNATGYYNQFGTKLNGNVLSGSAQIGSSVSVTSNTIASGAQTYSSNVGATLTFSIA
jgi:hypothetical protein